MLKKILVISIMLGVFVPTFSFGQETQLTPPETLDEAKKIGEKALEVGEKELPGIIQRIWQEEVMPIWQNMFGWFKINIWPKMEDWFKKIIEPEIEKRKPLIEEEFQKEKEEMKEEVKSDLPKVGQSLWGKFKELIK